MTQVRTCEAVVCRACTYAVLPLNMAQLNHAHRRSEPPHPRTLEAVTSYAERSNNTKIRRLSELKGRLDPDRISHGLAAVAANFQSVGRKGLCGKIMSMPAWVKSNYRPIFLIESNS
jgi:hypothetical protein